MADKSFEESVNELNSILERLNSENTTLDESIELFSKGMGLIGSCRRQLDDAQNRIQLLLRQNTSETSFAPLTGNGVPPAQN